jgi:hypothetical protein
MKITSSVILNHRRYVQSLETSDPSCCAFTPHCPQLGKARAGRKKEGQSGPRRRICMIGRDSLHITLLSAPMAVTKSGRCHANSICRHRIVIAATDAKAAATSSSHAAHVLEPTSLAHTQTKSAKDALRRMTSNVSRRGCGSPRLVTAICWTRLLG